ncbi:hypothetical protein PPGU16_82230 (plasmid) [Paraburkholderia largidicola]|uniref:Uncharacterized protein n=1 Tax=Paraburkholderia largidicola TaxID=3014751 RepID=A0A7I8C251_9BURK|nr:hypothetical protein PPGU16_82230 [Paraburkholderia sp. PGU16]
MLRCPTFAIRDLPEHAPHPLKVTDLAVYVIEMGASHTIGIRARPLGVVRKCDQITDLIDSEAELAATPNECQARHRGIVVLTIPVAVATSGG